MLLLLLLLFLICISIINCLYPGVSRLTTNERKISGSNDSIFIKLKSLSIYDMDIFAYTKNKDNGDGNWILQGKLKAGDTTSLGSRIGQQLKYVINDKEYDPFILSKSKVLYSLEDETTTDDMRNEINDENNYSIEYQKTYNRPWIGYYGRYGKSNTRSSERSPPTLFMYEAIKVGDKYEKISNAFKWVNGHEIKQSTTYTIEVISTAPKVFVIKDFLSDYEIDTIKTAASSILQNSEVGHESYGGSENDLTQRSSTSCWLSRGSSNVTESIYCRAADLLGIDRTKMTEKSNAEAIQVVHYDVDQRFNCHYGIFSYTLFIFILTTLCIIRFYN